MFKLWNHSVVLVQHAAPVRTRTRFCFFVIFIDLKGLSYILNRVIKI